MKWVVPLLVSFALPFVSGVSYAHHGGAFFDGSKKFTLTGPVVELRFMNPHVVLIFQARHPETGKVEEWIAETFSATRLAQMGWTKSTLRPGETITVVGNPAKSTSRRLLILELFRGGHEIVLNETETY